MTFLLKIIHLCHSILVSLCICCQIADPYIYLLQSLWLASASRPPQHKLQPAPQKPSAFRDMPDVHGPCRGPPTSIRPLPRGGQSLAEGRNSSGYKPLGRHLGNNTTGRAARDHDGARDPDYPLENLGCQEC